MTGSNESCDEIDEKVDRTAMTRMLTLADVLELIIDGLDDGSFPQQHFVGQGEESILHFFAEFGDELDALCDQKLLGKRLGEIAFVAEEVSSQFGNRTAIIDLARGEAVAEQVALLIDDEVVFEAKEPAHRGFASCCSSSKDAMLVNTSVLTDFQ